MLYMDGVLDTGEPRPKCHGVQGCLDVYSAVTTGNQIKQKLIKYHVAIKIIINSYEVHVVSMKS
jgi:hypothetical protein